MIDIAACALAVGTLGSASVFSMVALGHFAAAAAVTGLVSYAQTGKLSDGLLAAGETLLSEYAWSCTGLGLAKASWGEKVLAHGVVGGDLSVIEGGSFKDGFLSAAVSQAASAKIEGIDNGKETCAGIMARGAAAGVVGGTVAAVTGGNIENGVMTGAFAQMFNDDGIDKISKMLGNLKTKLSAGVEDTEAYYSAEASQGWSGAAAEGLNDLGAIPEGKEGEATLQEGELIIGKIDDINDFSRIKSGDYTLNLPNQGSPQANWLQNASQLRYQMSLGNPIRDVTGWDSQANSFASNTGFLKAERNLLQYKGWSFDTKTNYWSR